MARKKREIPLRNTTDVRRYVASVINRLENGELDPKLSGKLGYLSNVLTKVMELEVIEKRLDRLEQAAEASSAINVTNSCVKEITDGG